MEDTEGISDGALFPVGIRNPRITGRPDGVIVSSMQPWASLEELATQRMGPTIRMIAPEQHMDREAADALAAVAARAHARLDAQDELYGPDRIDGAVIRFVTRPGDGYRGYTYAALRANGAWYLTGGQSPQGLSWEELKAWMHSSKVESLDSLSDGYGLELDDAEPVRTDDPDMP